MKLRLPMLIAGVSLLFASAALAQGDLRLGWNNCRADGGLQNTSFTCATNTGSEILVGTFVPPFDLPAVIGLEALLYVIGEPTYSYCDGPGCPPPGNYDLPSWWHLQAGGCRATSLIASCNFASEPFASSTHCLDVWYGQAFAGLQYDYPHLSTKSARLRVAVAVNEASAAALVAGQEYYGFQVIVRNTKTVGTGACDGCCTPVTILFDTMTLTNMQPDGAAYFTFYPSGYEFFATWQNPSSCPTPTRNRTWGEIKATYR